MRKVVATFSAMVVMVALAAGVAFAANITCTTNPCQGTPNADRIFGSDEISAEPELIYALAGADDVVSGDGSDTVYGGRGNDVVDGYWENDTIYGGSGDDGSAEGTSFTVTNLEGAEDSDKVYGGEGADWIDAAAHDLFTDHPGSVDRSYGEEGNDHIYTIDGNEDIINCGPGTHDIVRMDAGIDTIQKDGGCEVVRTQ